jgi:hypothetical protein
LSDEEAITLEGAPAHGQHTHWRGGDWLEVAERPQLSIAPRPDEMLMRGPTKIKKHLYRRSANNRSVFVYQP